MGCRERATANLHCLLSRSRRLGAIVRRLEGGVDSTGSESRLSGERVHFISPTTFRFQHKPVSVCDPSMGSWSSWHATARTRSISGSSRELSAKTFVDRVLPLTLTFQYRSQQTSHKRTSGPRGCKFGLDLTSGLLVMLPQWATANRERQGGLKESRTTIAGDPFYREWLCGAGSGL